MDQNLEGEVVRWQEKLFARSVRRRNRLRQLQQLLGTTAGQDCLEISSGDGMISREMHRDGGNWTVLATDSAAQQALQVFAAEPVRVFSEALAELPDQCMDAVVVVDALERVRDDYGLIRECHRVLRTNGRLVLTTRRKLFLFVGGGAIRALLGLSWRRVGMVRPGYSMREFFDVLKDGFDVPATETYSSCCVEVPGMLCEAAANKVAHGPYNMPAAAAGAGVFSCYAKLCTFAALAVPVMWLSDKMDRMLGGVLPGHNLAAKTKRRVWSERRTPRLVDGRSIAEAAINTKIGTAAPF